MHPSAQRGESGPSNPPTKESCPAPGVVQDSTEHSLKNEVVKDPVRFWQFLLHNVCFWVNTMFSDGPRLHTNYCWDHQKTWYFKSSPIWLIF